MTKLFSKKKKTDDGGVLKAQAERIEELKKENYELNRELKRLREREESVSDALRLAKKLAKEYEQEAKIRFALECERLDAYREKYKGYIDNLSRAEKLGEEIIKTERLLKQCRDEMAEFIEEDFPAESPPEEDYLAETERILEIEPLPASECGNLSDEELKRLIIQLLEKEGKN